MKTPKFLSKLSAVLTPTPKKKLRATARAARPADMQDYDEQEPVTKLSSAFIVVLILHVVAVGGIYAFNSIKESRRDREAAMAAIDAPAPAKRIDAEATAKPAPAPANLAPTNNVESTTAHPLAAKPAAPGQYIVKSGDNLTKIALAFSTTRADLAAANNIKETALLQEGFVMTIPKHPAKPAASEDSKPAGAKAVTVPPTKTAPGIHIVKKGDTATSIARAYGLSAKDLLALNKISDPKKLQPGQSLKVPARKH